MCEMKEPVFKKGANINRLIFVGTGSGCGKTTVVCAVLGALKKAGKNPVSFKCGPDYIDPMFHSKVLGVKCKNLDLFMCGENTVRYLLSEGSKSSGVSIIEGVMGMYDGIGEDGRSSSNHLSLETNTPAVLVVNCSGVSTSAAAVVQGFLNFEKNNIKGILLNKISPAYYPMAKAYIERKTGVKVYGFMPREPRANLESRHLGLVTAAEVESLAEKIEILEGLASQYVDLPGLLELAESADPMLYDDIEVKPLENVKIAVAMDTAFCFYYEDNLLLLQKLGATLCPFSPLKDRYLPIGVHGLYLGGGYPELYLEELSANSELLERIKYSVQAGMPTFAECGGFMYLQEYVESLEGKRYDMAGVLKGGTRMTGGLIDFGYVTLTAKEDNVFCLSGGSINAHEFHYSKSEFPGNTFVAARPSGTERQCIHSDKSLFAGYPHVHLWGNIDFAKTFVEKCVSWAARNTDAGESPAVQAAIDSASH
ncbi:cobyrinate a,c-diamide synthase [Clostridia bacterium]|nr:cobyrinate a,c-diamide synthase [Clostridia bacterium]